VKGTGWFMNSTGFLRGPARASDAQTFSTPGGAA
jgi:hypothetical protein